MNKHHLNLLLLLTKKNFKNSDYHSVLGVLWSFVGPTATFAVTFAIFNQRMGKHIGYFPLRLMVAIVLISFFTKTCGYIMRFLRSNSQTMLNTNIPFEILILSSLSVPTFKFLVEITLCALVAFCLGLFSPFDLPILGVLILLFFIFTLGAGFLLCLLYSLAADVEEIWIIGTRLFLFITPAFYTLDMLSSWGRKVVIFANPLTPYTLCFQKFITHQTIPFYIPFQTWILLLSHTFIFFIAGYLLFKKFNKKLLEVV